jgi:hypothetical protein
MTHIIFLIIYIQLKKNRKGGIRIYKIGDYNLDQNVVDSKATIILLRLGSTAKIEYKLISSPPLSWSDQLLKL